MMPNPNQSLITTASSSNDILDETSKEKHPSSYRHELYHRYHANVIYVKDNPFFAAYSKKKNHYTNRKNKYHSEYQITIDKNKLVHNILENKYVKDILNV
ncbi:hypothetical protein PFMALIP_00654 [Plasmodium falciparum MaliPS096_E11]|uniref:Uncharacterized protein n=4 Tax=Plasmodium falciparum TaxID=5833 RepID=A0A024WVL1_PLAFA|nr:hypothetical protein PFMALIP_00654 [Plasmodium falciparum MaliPS096_E11]